MIEPVILDNPETLAQIEEILGMKHIKETSGYGAKDVVVRAVEKYVKSRRANENYAANVHVWRSRLYARQAGRCAYCNRKVSRKNGTLDHIVPIDRGGVVDDIRSLIFCCYECNQEKGAATAEEFRNMKLLEKRMCPKCTPVDNSHTADELGDKMNK